MKRGMVIVGAGHAGCRTAHALREHGWTGHIHLINGEDRPPYERPPLSKGVLLGEATTSDAQLLTQASRNDAGMFYREGVQAVAIDRTARQVTLSDGSDLPYERLLLATGAQSRSLAVRQSAPPGVLALRSAADCDALAATMLPGARIVIVGGGLIGLEVAATAIGRGCRVTIIEMGSRLLARVVPPEIGNLVREDHEAAGIAIRFGETLADYLGQDRIEGVRLSSGEEIACDVVLISIGAQPDVALALACGLEVDNGIVVNSRLQTSDPAIYAAGDVCCVRGLPGRAPLRLECWKNAEEQGALAARNMLGADMACDGVPWMWSDQYEKVIQVAGMPALGTSIVLKDLGVGSFAAFQFDDAMRLIAVSGYGAVGPVAKAVRMGTKMIENGVSPAPEAIVSTPDLRALVTGRAA